MENKRGWISTFPFTGFWKAFHWKVPVPGVGGHRLTTNVVGMQSWVHLQRQGDLARLRTLSVLKRLNPSQEVTLKASVPGPYTLSGRLIPGGSYTDRFAVTEALLPLVRKELEDLVRAGCSELTVDEPSMSCYAHREDAHRLVDIFNRTVEPVVGHCRLSTHLCFGNFKGHAVGLRRYAPMFPAFMEMKVDEMHLEMASREMAELDIIASLSERFHVAVGLVDVKSYFIESPELIADRVRACLKYAPADRLSIAPDCGLSQTARWAAKAKLHNMVAGVEK